MPKIVIGTKVDDIAIIIFPTMVGQYYIHSMWPSKFLLQQLS